MEKSVLITSRSFGSLSKLPEEILKSAGIHSDKLEGCFDPEYFAHALPQYDALIAGVHEIPPELLKACPKLRIIAKHGVGLDNIPLQAAREMGIVVTNTPGANSEAVADLAFGLMISVARRIALSERHLRSGVFTQDMGTDVHGKTLGLLGFGRIAQGMARRAAGFSMPVLAYDPYVTSLSDDWKNVRLCDLAAVLKNSDFISLHLPLTDETRSMIGKAEILMMKPGAYIINAARGGIICEDDLCDAIENGHIAGAALDVAQTEPVPPSSRLMRLDNIVLTNHIGMYSREAAMAVSVLCAKAVADCLSGKTPQNAVV